MVGSSSPRVLLRRPSASALSLRIAKTVEPDPDIMAASVAGLLQKELFEFGEELELFEDGAFEVVNENLVASSLLSVGDFWEFAGFFPSGVSPGCGDAESGFEEEDASIPIELCWFNNLAASTTPARELGRGRGECLSRVGRPMRRGFREGCWPWSVR